MIRWLDSTAWVTVSSADCTRGDHLRRARVAGDPGEVELQRGERAADVVVDLARDRRALVLDAGLQVLRQLVQALLRGDQVAVGLDAGAPRLGRLDGVQQRRHQPRQVVLLQVVAAPLRIASTAVSSPISPETRMKGTSRPLAFSSSSATRPEKPGRL